MLNKDMTEQELNLAFTALSHPARRGMLAQLKKGPANVNHLAAPLNMSLPAVSRHVKMLERAGLITRERDAQFRPCVLNPDALKQVADWTEQYRSIWEARFDQLESVLNKIQEP